MKKSHRVIGLVVLSTIALVVLVVLLARDRAHEDRPPTGPAVDAPVDPAAAQRPPVRDHAGKAPAAAPAPGMTLTREQKDRISREWDGGRKDRETSFTRQELFGSGREAFERRKEQLVSEIVDHIARRLRETLPKVTDAQVGEVLEATVESRSATLENQYMFHTGQRSQDDTIAENARIIRRYADRVLDALGEEQYKAYTGLDPEDDAWEVISTLPRGHDPAAAPGPTPPPASEPSPPSR